MDRERNRKNQKQKNIEDAWRVKLKEDFLIWREQERMTDMMLVCQDGQVQLLIPLFLLIISRLPPTGSYLLPSAHS